MAPPPLTAVPARSSPGTSKERGPRPALTVVEWPDVRGDVLASKLQIPELRTEAVARAGLVNRLRTETARLVLVVAAPGYGKTTLLAQWASKDERPFAWLSLDEHDDDPITLLCGLAAALEAAGLELEVAKARAASADIAAARLAAAVSVAGHPFVLVLDNVECLRRREASEVVLALAKSVPAGSALVLAGRSAPPLPIARLRAAGWLLELGASDLELGRREALLLLRGVDRRLGDTRAAALVEQAEGWPAGLHLAALAPGPPESAFPGGAGVVDRYVAEYFESEHLAHLKPARLAFLRRTSVLERMSGPLCDAVLDTKGSADQLAELSRANQYLAPLDRTGDWYRYHGLFRAVLRAELERREPELAQTLHIRASEWFEAHGDRESALDHALSAGDATRAARLLLPIALPVYFDGRLTLVEAWLERFAAIATLDEHPGVAVVGGWLHALGGRAAEAEHCLAAAERSDPASTLPGGEPVQPWIALLRAALCAHGVARMQRDVRTALAGLPAESVWRPVALLVAGAAHLMDGDDRAADRSFVAAADAAQHVGAWNVRVVALSERSLLAGSAGDHRAAEQLALEARDVLAAAASDAYVSSALGRAAAARAFLRHGRWDDARRELATAESLAGRLTHALPWFAVQTRLALAGAYVTLRDRPAACAELAEIEKIVAPRPHLGVHVAQVAALRAEIDELPDARDGRSAGLTAAELRLLPFLATHLSFREIGERLFVSRNTIKTQAISVYRKLGVSSRTAAIERASELGLVDDAAAEAEGFTRTG